MNNGAADLSKHRDHLLIVEKDVPIPMRDGTILYADIFRPDADDLVPAIMNISVYQKDKFWIPPEDLEEQANPHMNWETGWIYSLATASAVRLIRTTTPTITRARRTPFTRAATNPRTCFCRSSRRNLPGG